MQKGRPVFQNSRGSARPLLPNSSRRERNFGEFKHAQARGGLSRTAANRASAHALVLGARFAVRESTRTLWVQMFAALNLVRSEQPWLRQPPHSPNSATCGLPANRLFGHDDPFIFGYTSLSTEFNP